MLWNNPSVYSLYIYHCDWFNKQANWPIAEQDKVKQESQTENKLDIQNGIEVKATSLGAAQRLLVMS